MDPPDALLALRQAIAARFPDEAARADALLAEGAFDDDAHPVWLETFSQMTTDAMGERDEAHVAAHLAFMAAQLDGADDAVRMHIDVYYVESLMWELDAEGKRWGWQRMPESLKRLYVGMWGEPGF